MDIREREFDEWDEAVLELYRVDFLLAQPKLDGIYAEWDGACLRSRSGAALRSVDHLVQSMDDGGIRGKLAAELYIPGMDFNRINGLARRQATDAETRELELHIFSRGDGRLLQKRDAFITGTGNGAGTVRFVPITRITDKEHLERLHAWHLAEGFEGTILRHVLREAEGGAGWKWKPVHDFEAVCRSVEGLSARLIMAGPECALEFGCRITECCMRGDRVTVACDGFHPGGRPRNPRMKGVRWDLEA